MPPAENALDSHCLRLAAALGATVEACRPVFDDLGERYRSPDRYYHTLDHIAAVLDVIQTLAGPSPAPALLTAAWFHDAVYDPRAADNEERSADQMRAVLAPFPAATPLLAEAERLILLTKTHDCTTEDRDGHVLLDADLAILGAAEAAYDVYASAIRREYAWVPDEDYRKGRTRVLQSFLNRARIYWTGALFRSVENRARANLRCEIAGLAGGKASSFV